jgi:hypothetical protein
MSDLNVSRPGQVNATGDARALFLKMFSGEVLTAFHETNVFMPLHMVRTLKSGKSSQFPVTGTASVHYHQPGTEIVGQKIKGAERTINIDHLAVADVSIANIDEAMAQFEYRSIYTRELGEALAHFTDENLGRLLCLAARGSSVLDGGPDGAVLNTIANTNSASELIAAIGAAKVILKEKKVPPPYYCALRPEQHMLLVQDRTALNRDWNGAGSFATGTLPQILGVNLVETIHVPSANTSAPSFGEENTYHGTFDKTVAIVWNPRAIGTVKLMDLATESEYSVRHQATLVVSKYAMGHGILRPECAVEITED